MRFFILALVVGVTTVFAPDEGAGLTRSVVRGFGRGSAPRSPTAFAATGTVRVLAAETKNTAPREVRAPTRAKYTRFGNGLCGLSGCGTSTNLFIAVYRQHD